MKQLWMRLYQDLASDDLFFRMVCFVAGGVLAVAGAGIVAWSTLGAQSPVWLRVLVWPLGLSLVAWGVLILLRCFVSAQSEIGRMGAGLLPDSPDIAFLAVIVVIGLPLALLTLVLHALGIRGQAYATQRAKKVKTKKPRKMG